MATLRETEYNIVRENLRIKYAPEKLPFYWVENETERILLPAKRNIYIWSIWVWKNIINWNKLEN
jgi:hypothetical protein